MTEFSEDYKAYVIAVFDKVLRFNFKPGFELAFYGSDELLLTLENESSRYSCRIPAEDVILDMSTKLEKNMILDLAETFVKRVKMEKVLNQLSYK